MHRRTLGSLLSVSILALLVFVTPSGARAQAARKAKKKPTTSTQHTAAAKKAASPVKKAAAPAKKPAPAHTTATRKPAPAHTTATRKPAPAPAATAKKAAVPRKATTTRRTRRSARWTPTTVWTARPTLDPTEGDDVSGDDPAVRVAAVQALGPLYGSVVVVDPSSGRVLSMVNQKLALGRGYTPCSTIKMPVTLAALQEGVLNPAKPLQLTRRWSLSLTDALAHSNNQFFEKLGSTLGFEKLSKYEREFGFGELAGYNIAGETLGTYPEEPPRTGVGHMSSFGDPISVTPLQLAAFVSAVANGGILYYLQYPKTTDEKEGFQPRVKRQLEYVKQHLQPLREGMIAAVERGTARRLEDPYGQVLGKTGTCSEDGERLGWFASYESPDNPKLAVVVLLRGGRYTAGPLAAQVAGRVYSHLHQNNYYATRLQPTEPIRSSPLTTPATAVFEGIR